MTAGLDEKGTIHTRITTYLLAGLTQLRTEHKADTLDSLANEAIELTGLLEEPLLPFSITGSTG